LHKRLTGDAWALQGRIQRRQQSGGNCQQFNLQILGMEHSSIIVSDSGTYERSRLASEDTNCSWG
jgi:hypothetical protein